MPRKGAECVQTGAEEEVVASTAQHTHSCGRANGVSGADGADRRDDRLFRSDLDKKRFRLTAVQTGSENIFLWSEQLSKF